MQRSLQSGILLIVTVPFLAACSLIEPEPLEGTREDYERALEEWRAQHITAYSFEYERACTCTPREVGPVRIHVRDGEIVDVVDGATDRPLSEAVWDEFPTVEGLFDIIAAAIDASVTSISVQYDSELSYPKRVRIDRTLAAVDDRVEHKAEGLAAVE